ncbi:MAG: 3-dehydroquinate synthase [Mariprofundales bacterium]
MSTNHTYRVDLGERAYEIHICDNSLDELPTALEPLFGIYKRCLIVSNDIVAPLYLQRIQKALESANWVCDSHIFPDGEQYKNIEQWQSLLDKLMSYRLSRREPLLALGGGVVGDMAGFAAACYRRGIPFVQIPTTLLAQVDSSVGGKTAINHPHGKNMIGAFYQPKLVWIDPQVLHTLPAREVRAGLAECLKYGLIRDIGMVDWMEKNASDLLLLDSDIIAELILRWVRHKAEIVIEDETEQGVRALLNLGHTFGHAIEALTNYRKYLHGEAVAIGMRMAADISVHLQYCSPACSQRVLAALQILQMPYDIPNFSSSQWLDAMGHDKKNIGNHIRYILLRDIGDAFICDDVSNEAMISFLNSYS